MPNSNVLASGQSQMPLTNSSVQPTLEDQLAQENICGQEVFCTAFPTTEALLLLWLVVIKLMIDSVQVFGFAPACPSAAQLGRRV